MAFDPNKPANDGFLADAPQELRTNFAGLKDDQIVNAGSLRGLVPGNASGNIPINNGTLNTNLNAEKLGGQPASYFAPATHTHATATSSSNGFMSNTDKAKLDTIATGAEVNQNAFSNILVGGTTIQADSKTDTLELVAGTNISLSPDATNDRVTINCTYTHPTGDGNLHVPATGTSNNGKVLKAGASAGSIAWGTLSASDITNTPAGNISATTVQAAINELDSEKVNVSEVVTTATANKILKLDSNGKLPASITGDAATVGGKTPGTGAGNVLVLDGSGKVPQGNLPIASASTLGAIKVGANLSIDANGVLSATAPSHGKQLYTTPGTYTFTVPAGVTKVYVSMCGGGGGGGGGYAEDNSVGGGGGGGAGAAVIAQPVTGLTPGQNITVTVGEGGAGGAVKSNGSSGGASSFGSYISCPGGGGGVTSYNPDPRGGSAGGSLATPGGNGTYYLNSHTQASGSGGNNPFSGGAPSIYYSGYSNPGISAGGYGVLAPGYLDLND